MKRGDSVRAFHPGRFGVINHGTITKMGSKYVYIDFGGHTRRVHPIHVVEILPQVEVEPIKD